MHFFFLYSDGEEVTLADNFNDIFHPLKYEADLLFTRFVFVTMSSLKFLLLLSLSLNKLIKLL